MNKLDFHKEGFYEDYLMGRLSEPEETSFEEHLLFCATCRQELRKMEIVLEGVKMAGNDAGLSMENKRLAKSNTTRIWRLAAAILIMLGSTAVFYFLWNKNNQQPKSQDFTITDTIPSKESNSEFLEPSEPELYVENSKPKELPKTDELLASAFVPSEFYENLIDNIHRAEPIQVVSPKRGQTFRSGDKLKFDWKTTDSLTLVIMDNQGKIRFEEKIIAPYTLKTNLPSGLFYWQIENEEEALYVEKFIIGE